MSNELPTATLVGEDPYTAIVHPDYLYKGERFRVEHTDKDGSKHVYYGRLDMHGHAVSPNFGYLKYEEEGKVDAAQVARAKQAGKDGYINVIYDHRPQGLENGWGGLDNESIYFNRDGGWTFYSLPEYAARERKLREDGAQKRRLAALKKARDEAVREHSAAFERMEKATREYVAAKSGANPF